MLGRSVLSDATIIGVAFVIVVIVTSLEASAQRDGATRFGLTGPGPVVRLRNSGTACFQRITKAGETHVVVRFSPAFGCLSSSCTERLQADFDVTVRDGDAPALEMTSTFAIRDRNRRICTRDCGGGGRAMRQIQDLAPGSYAVTLGGTAIGTLVTEALATGESVCFSGG